MIRWLKMQFSKRSGWWSGGLSKSGPWNVLYPDGQRSRGLAYGEARNLREIFGGTLEYRPRD